MQGGVQGDGATVIVANARPSRMRRQTEAPPKVQPSTPNAPEVILSQQFTHIPMSPISTIFLIQEYLHAHPWALATEISPGSSYISGRTHSGAILSIQFKNVKRRSDGITWGDIGDVMKDLLDDPIIHNKWESNFSRRARRFP